MHLRFATLAVKKVMIATAASAPASRLIFKALRWAGDGGLVGCGDGGAGAGVVVVDEFRFRESSQIASPPDGAAFGFKQTTVGEAK